MSVEASRFRVLIATTEGPVEIVSLEAIDIPASHVVLASEPFKALRTLSNNYDDFVSIKTGIVGRLYNSPGFRLEISGMIDDGHSWQLGVLLAHALHAAGRLAGPGDGTAAVLLATGEVGRGELRLGRVGYVERKLDRAMDRLKEAAKSSRVIVAWPRDNHDDAAPAIDNLKHLGADIVEAETFAGVLDVLQLPPPAMAADAQGSAWTEGSPFLGLVAFDDAHRAVFFGRGQAREESLERLRMAAAQDCAFLLVYGRSGSGKSSLVRAGLAGDICETADEADAWLVETLIAGRGTASPLITLAETLVAAIPELALDAAGVAAAMRDRPGDVTSIIRKALEERSKGRRTKLVLIVDQLEELLLWARERNTPVDANEREAFAVVLDRLARSRAVWVVATIRSDLLTLLEDSPALSRLAANERRFALLPPTRAELREIVRRPAEMAGLRFEGTDPSGLPLTDVLVEAAMASPDSLPLLEFVLGRLYEASSRTRKITFEAYSRIGGLEGAIGQWADKTVEAFGSGGFVTRSLHDVLLALGRYELDGGRIVARATSIEPAFAGGVHRRIIEALVAARLLVLDTVAGTDGKPIPVVRVAHEALLTHWPYARSLFAENIQAVDLRDRLDSAAARWAASPDDAYLPAAGRPLDEAKALLAAGRVTVSRATQAFIGKAVEKAALQRRQRGATLLLFGMLLSLVGVFFWAMISVSRPSAPSPFQVASDLNWAEQRIDAMESEITRQKGVIAERDYMISKQDGVIAALTEEYHRVVDSRFASLIDLAESTGMAVYALYALPTDLVDVALKCWMMPPELFSHADARCYGTDNPRGYGHKYPHAIQSSYLPALNILLGFLHSRPGGMTPDPILHFPNPGRLSLDVQGSCPSYPGNLIPLLGTTVECAKDASELNVGAALILIARSVRLMPRCLEPEEAEDAGLSRRPPNWCIGKPPYDNPGWKS